MSDEITEDIFRHLVELSALAMDEAEAEYLRRELNNALNAIHELEAIPIDRNIEITSHGTRYTPEIIQPIRSDTLKPFHKVKAILDQMPQIEDGYIVVPDVPHKTLK